MVVVRSGGDAARFAHLASRAVLVIDAGLLEAPYDQSWARFRAAHPDVGVVIRCLVPHDDGARRRDDRTLCVHPANAAALRDAVRHFLAGPGDDATPPGRIVRTSRTP